MGIAVSSGVLDVPSLLHGGASAFSEASSPQKLPSFTMHVLLPDEAADDVLPRNGDLVVKTLDAAEEEARSSCAPHRRRLVPGAECDRIVEKDAKDNLAEYNSLQAPRTVQGHRHLVEESGGADYTCSGSGRERESPAQALQRSRVARLQVRGAALPATRAPCATCCRFGRRRRTPARPSATATRWQRQAAAFGGYSRVRPAQSSRQYGVVGAERCTATTGVAHRLGHRLTCA
ncbi:uncharacterized protein [Dermacentor albipictus]|uniref:uncharacterized protein isoform X2 n=1 Tax=Dermacentor albipictus TaxID=60249 RepID=UPI0031FD7E7A